MNRIRHNIGIEYNIDKHYDSEPLSDSDISSDSWAHGKSIPRSRIKSHVRSRDSKSRSSLSRQIFTKNKSQRTNDDSSSTSTSTSSSSSSTEVWIGFEPFEIFYDPNQFY